MIRPFLTGLALASLASTAQAQSCDADCMTGIANRYMDAVVKHDPWGLPWADRVGYAEHGTKLRVGEGSWVTIDKRGTAPLVVADPENGHVVWIGSVEDHGQPAFYAMDMAIRPRHGDRTGADRRRQQGHPTQGRQAALWRPDRLPA
jgi:hypothetical protein